MASRASFAPTGRLGHCHQPDDPQHGPPNGGFSWGTPKWWLVYYCKWFMLDDLVYPYNLRNTQIWTALHVSLIHDKKNKLPKWPSKIIVHQKVGAWFGSWTGTANGGLTASTISHPQTSSTIIIRHQTPLIINQPSCCETKHLNKFIWLDFFFCFYSTGWIGWWPVRASLRTALPVASARPKSSARRTLGAVSEGFVVSRRLGG